MQITPATADYIAQKSGGTRFEQGDLATPQINISYGSWYLRYLLDRYDGNVVLALCAYNGGEGNVDRWLQEAHVADTAFTLERVPFAETREYVKVVIRNAEVYRRLYGSDRSPGLTSAE